MRRGSYRGIARSRHRIGRQIPDRRQPAFSIELLEERSLLDGSPINFDQTVTDSIATAGEIDSWTFEGTAGQGISIQFDGPGADLALVGPSSQIVLQAVQEPNFWSYLVVLPENGAYRVDVTAPSPPVNYELTVFQEFYTPIAYDEPVDDQMTTGGYRFYTFQGTAGQVVQFDVGDPDFDVFWSARPITTEPPTQPADFLFETELRDQTAQLPLTGTYEIYIDSFDPVDYEFQLTATDPAAQPITYGELVTGQIQTAETRFFEFPGNSGDLILVDVNAYGLFDWRIFGPEGTQLVDTRIDGHDVVSLPADGDYRLQLMFNGDGEGGSAPFDFQFIVHLVPDPVTTAVLFNSTRNGEISVPGEFDIYTFTGASGQPITLDALSGSSTVFTWRLTDPTGQVLHDDRFRTAVDIPLTLPATGQYQLVVDGIYDATGGYGFRVLSATAPEIIPISVDQLVTDAITSGTDVHDYEFAVTAGQILFLDFRSLSGGSLTTSLIDPSSHIVRTVTAPTFDAHDYGPVAFTSSGNYRLRVETTGTTGRTFQFQIEPVNSALNLGDVLTADIGLAGEVDLHTFQAAAGQRLYFDAISGSSSSFTWRVHTPSGGTLFATSFADRNVTTIPETGTYALVIDGTGTATGTYTFRVYEARPIDRDTVIAGAISVAGEDDAYTFEITAPQRVYFDALAGSRLTFNWTLYSPAGAEIFGGDFTDEDTLLLATPGTYQLVVEGQGSGTGNYQFELVSVPEPTTTPIEIGQVTSGSIAIRGESDFYTFAAVAGQRVYFDAQVGSRLVFDWRLTNPAGGTVFSDDFTDFDTLVLSQSGTYTLRLDAEGAGTGGCQFELVSVPEPTTTPINIGDVVSGTIAVRGERDYFTFPAEAGQRVYFDAQLGSQLDYDWVLRNPFGGVVFSDDFQDIDTTILSATGTYTLEVDALTTHTGDYRFRVIPVAAPVVQPILVGQVVAGNIGAIGEVDVYTFDVAAGTVITFDAQVGSSSIFDWRLRNPSGTSVFNANFSDRTNVTLTAAGTYSLEIDADFANLGKYQFQLIPPAADLIVTSVTAADSAIGDPAELAVTWTVRNQGVGATAFTSWVDRIIASTDTTVGDSDDITLASFIRDGALAGGSSYTRAETLVLPAGLTGRFYLYVRTDATNSIFELNQEGNNTTQKPGFLDVMPIPYADLAVTSISPPTSAYAGRSIAFSWTVANQGIGPTNRGDWIDRVYLARNVDGSNAFAETQTDVPHAGSLDPSGSYTATAQITAPNGISGNFYLVVETAKTNGMRNVVERIRSGFDNLKFFKNLPVKALKFSTAICYSSSTCSMGSNRGIGFQPVRSCRERQAGSLTY